MSYFTINTAVANVYAEASHSSAVVTQALMGENCIILENNAEWYKIQQWDGYKAWIYYFYGVERKNKYKTTMALKDMVGMISSLGKDKMISHLLFGSRVHAEKKHNGYQITLPDGRTGFSKNNYGENDKNITRDKIVKTAERFLGTPYVWGGKTPYGTDCSGLVQTVFYSIGIKLPRDAHQQEVFLSKNILDEKNIEPGDLLFFSENHKVTHVAISIGGLNFVNSRGFVQEESIDTKNPLFNRKLRNLFLHATSIKHLLK